MILCGYLGHSARPLAPLVAMSRVVRGWGRLVRRQKRLITPPGGADTCVKPHSAGRRLSIAGLPLCSSDQQASVGRLAEPSA